MTILRAAKIELYPTNEQKALLNLWRNRGRSLWNLLVEIEAAAYSGAKAKPHIGWRPIWNEVMKDAELAAIDKNKKVKPANSAAILPNAGMQPKLFLWDDELTKVMVRLKAVPHTKWIAELHSHAAQRICKDLCLALKAMISSAKKGDGRGGFPRFKRNGYAEGSIYFANTQIAFGDENRMKFPRGVGLVKHGNVNANIPKGAKLMGGRAFREGERWWIAVQFEFAKPVPLPKTGRNAGIKVTARIPYAIDDGMASYQYPHIEKTIRDNVLSERKSRHLSRKKRGSKSWYKAAAIVAADHAKWRDRRNDCLHKASKEIINNFDKITIDKIDVASLMQGEVKKLRKIVHESAMARAAQFIEYKAETYGREVTRTEMTYPSIQNCSSCGHKNEHMKIYKRKFYCEACALKLDRRVNAAKNMQQQGVLMAAE